MSKLKIQYTVKYSKHYNKDKVKLHNSFPLAECLQFSEYKSEMLTTASSPTFWYRPQDTLAFASKFWPQPPKLWVTLGNGIF